MSKKWRFTNNELDLIQDFVETIDEELVVEKGSAWECCISTNEIFLGSKRINKFDKCFITWLRTLPEYTPISNFIIALLHEIGHIKSYNHIVWANGKLQEMTYRYLHEDGILNDEELQYKYFEIANEKNATLWALEYYKSHKAKCDKLAEMVGCGSQI